MVGFDIIDSGLLKISDDEISKQLEPCPCTASQAGAYPGFCVWGAQVN